MPNVETEKKTVSVVFEWAEVDSSLDVAYERAMEIAEVRNLNPDSDYTEQYYTIEVSAMSVKFIFREEPA